MKKINKVLLSLLCTIAAITPLSTKANAAEKEVPEHVQELMSLNSDGFNEFFSQLDLESEDAVIGEAYLKVIESPNGSVILDKQYTSEEYLSESIKIEPYSSVNVTNWLRLEYSIYPKYNNPKEAGLSMQFKWLKKPAFQGTDIITLSTDGTIVTPGSNNIVNAAFWPNMTVPNIVASYSNLNGSSSDKAHFEFDNYGVSFKHTIASDLFVNDILSLYKYQDHFTNNGRIWYTEGCPQYSLSTFVTRSTTDTESGKVLFTYNHQQITLNFSPQVSIDGTGDVSVTGGLTAGFGFDKASTSIRYNWGSSIW